MAVLGGITGTMSLLWQVWKHRADRRRFKTEAEMMVTCDRGRTELQVKVTATNHGPRSGYVREFRVEYSSGVPSRSLGFISRSQQPVSFEPGEAKNYEMSIPVEDVPFVAKWMSSILIDTQGRKVTKKFRTLGKELLVTTNFTSPKMPPSLVAQLQSSSLKGIKHQ